MRPRYALTKYLGRKRVNAVEEFVEGRGSIDELEHMQAQYNLLFINSSLGDESPEPFIVDPYLWAKKTFVGDWKEDWFESQRQAQVQVLHCVFGDPFCQKCLDPILLSRNNEAVYKIASAIYSERNFEEIPMLGSALVAAGCQDEDIVSHCFRKAPHVLGCWVLDLVLGKQ